MDRLKYFRSGRGDSEGARERESGEGDSEGEREIP